MRGGVQLIVALCGVGIVCAMRCDRTPDGVVSPKSTPDGRFSLSISGNPEKYVPGTSYTVSINGTRSTHMPPKFIGFSLIVESTNPFRVRDGGETEIPPVGSLQLFADALVKHSEKCPNMVTQTSSLPKNEIQIRWTAPPSGNGCIVFKATVVEHRDVWFQDDGPLTKTLCEDVQENLDMQPEALKECCACNEAKYEVAFEGMWSRHTHPKDFPSNSWLTRFSDVIGASHTTDYRFWEYGGIASEGLRNVAERGSTRMLESELKDHSQDIRTIIKARGISYPNVTAKTFAVFRVDRKHHLMSLVSMIDPSPDWIVGVSGLELCLKNCSWIESKVLNLYPWDAGTDSGVTYISPDIPTDPRDNIRRITSSFPNDPQSPFYDTAGEEMKPLARLHLTRQRIYPQKCEDTTDATRPVPLVCSVGAWGEWSECSATCGQGNRKKQRFYLYPDLADQYNCKKKLTQREPCYSALSCGPAEPVEPTEDPMCALTDWSDWSRCSVSCGQGVRLRYRTLKSKSAWKYCSPKGLRTQQTDICSSYSAVCGPSYKIFETLPEEEAKEKPSLCEMTNWSEWSPCNATCASIYGTRVRIRTLLLYKGMPATAASSYGNRDEDDNETEGEKEKGDEDVDEMYPDRENKEEPCPELPRRLEMPCNVSAECIYTPEKAKEICQMPREVGLCPGRLRKFYFDTTDQECKKFVYSGCRGNDNRFDSLEECESVCATVKEELMSNRAARLQHFGVSVSGVVSYSIELQDTSCETTEVDNTSSTTTADPSMRGESLVNATDVTEVTERPVVDCKMSKWSKWTQCSATCGKGFKKKSRNIVMNAQNGGKACPKKTIKKRRCHVRCPDHSGRSGKKHKKDDDDCVYSEWSTWSQCTVSCGPTSVQQRSRNVDYGQTLVGAQCENRFEVRACYVLPCKDT